MDQPFLASIIMFAANFAPRGWAFCNGQTLPISTNTALFSLIGTTYGGDGIRSFMLPDMQGRVPVHAGNGNGLSPYVPGQAAGTESITLIANQMPMHNHAVGVHGTPPGNSGSPIGNYLAATTALASEKVYTSLAPTGTMNPAMIGMAGSNAPFSVVQPYLCVNFIIALTGIFPSRD